MQCKILPHTKLPSYINRHAPFPPQEILLASLFSLAITRTSRRALRIPHHHIIPHRHTVLGLLQYVAQFGILRVHQIHRFQLRLVAYARVRAGVDEEVRDGVGGVPLRGGEGVYEADGFVQGGIALQAVQGVDFEVLLVEEGVKDFIYGGGKWINWVE